VDPAGPLVGVSPQKIKFYQASLRHIKIVQNYLKSDKVCFPSLKTKFFINNSFITKNECVIAFLKSL
jgi:hypothetical protein